MDEQAEVVPPRTRKRGRPKKNIVKTPAERQADSRAKRKKNERQLNIWVSTKAFAALGKLAKRDGVTKSEAIERLIEGNSSSVIKQSILGE